MTHQIIDVQTGNSNIVSLTESELVEIEIEKKKFEESHKKAAEAAAAKAALLEKLGITEEEAKLLLS